MTRQNGFHKCFIILLLCTIILQIEGLTCVNQDCTGRGGDFECVGLSPEIRVRRSGSAFLNFLKTADEDSDICIKFTLVSRRTKDEGKQFVIRSGKNESRSRVNLDELIEQHKKAGYEFQVDSSENWKCWESTGTLNPKREGQQDDVILCECRDVDYCNGSPSLQSLRLKSILLFCVLNILTYLR